MEPKYKLGYYSFTSSYHNSIYVVKLVEIKLHYLKWKHLYGPDNWCYYKKPYFRTTNYVDWPNLKYLGKTCTDETIKLLYE